MHEYLLSPQADTFSCEPQSAALESLATWLIRPASSLDADTFSLTGPSLESTRVLANKSLTTFFSRTAVLVEFATFLDAPFRGSLRVPLASKSIATWSTN